MPYYLYLHLIFPTYDLFFVLCFILNLKDLSDIYIAAPIIMSLVIVKWSSVGLLNVLIVIVVCNVVYAAILLLLGGIKKEKIGF